MGRPTKQQQIAIVKRNEKIEEMRGRGYPIQYIADFFSISKYRISQIINKMNKNEEKNKENL